MRNYRKAVQTIWAMAFVILGFALVLGANTFQAEILKIRVDELLAHLGVLIALIFALQWIYDNHVRERHFEEIRAAILKTTNVAESGICDFADDSITVDYADALARSKEVVLGLLYSPRFLERYFELLRGLAKSGAKIDVLLIEKGCPALAIVTDRPEPKTHVVPDLDKCVGIVKQLQQEGPNVRLHFHKAVLRYSFVKMDNAIWVRFYRNSAGRGSVPAFAVKSRTKLYDFFDNDIQELLAKATAHG
jgi:hypothetical protein